MARTGPPDVIIDAGLFEQAFNNIAEKRIVAAGDLQVNPIFRGMCLRGVVDKIGLPQDRIIISSVQLHVGFELGYEYARLQALQWERNHER